jgi:hypothetical protein
MHRMMGTSSIPMGAKSYFQEQSLALNGPYPAKINVPKIAQDGSSDYEAELSIVLSKSEVRSRLRTC